MSNHDIPNGFRLLNRNSPFSDLTGPYFEQVDENGKHTVLGIRLTNEHLNKIGVAHGGTMMTIADNAFGDAILAHYDHPVAFVTVTLNSEFLSAAKAGDWVEARVNIHRAGKRMIFAGCALTVEGKHVFNASGVFSLIEKRQA